MTLCFQCDRCKKLHATADDCGKCERACAKAHAEEKQRAIIALEATEKLGYCYGCGVSNDRCCTYFCWLQPWRIALKRPL